MSEFSLEQCKLVLNGHEVTGWSDDTDAISFPNIDIASVKRGADGKMASSSSGEKGGPVVMKLLANSPSAKFFQNAATAQLNGAAVSWNGIFRDPINGISVAMTQGTLTNVPLGPTMGKGDVANKEFTIEFETVVADYSGASF